MTKNDEEYFCSLSALYIHDLSPAATSADLPLVCLTCSRPANVYYNYVSVDSIQLPQLSTVPCCSLGHRLGSFGLFVTSLVTSQSRLLTTKATLCITDRFFFHFLRLHVGGRH